MKSNAVLPAGPSDHRPVMFQVGYKGIRGRDGHFMVGNWNTNHGTTWNEGRDVMKMIFAFDPDVLVLQEVAKYEEGWEKGLRDLGFNLRHAEPEFLIAWQRRGRFHYRHHTEPTMNKTPYWRDENKMLRVVLEDHVAHQVVEFYSMHPPAHVQAPGHVTNDRVMQVHKEFAAKRAKMAKRADREHRHVACFGDSNIDPEKGWSPPGGWGFEYDRRQSGLNYVRANAPTHHVRHIDEGQISDGLRMVE